MGEEMFFLSILGGMGIFTFIIGVVLYVLKSIGLMTLASNRGIENAWLAWLPIADLYIMGAIVEEMNFFGYQVTNLGLWLPLISLGGMVLGSIPVLGWFIVICAFVFSVGVMYNLFNMYTTNALLFTILSILLCLFAVFIFVIRNNTPLDRGPSIPV